jgi:YegS/Rv2252/BmrU family lipid kinase
VALRPEPIEKTAVVLNPRAAAGRAGRAWPEIQRRLHEVFAGFALLRTERRGHATELVRNALHDGFTRIVSVGGDGTHHEVVNGFFDGVEPINRDAVMAVLPIGTGSDLGRTLHLPRGAAAIPYLERGVVMRADVGRVTFTRADGTPATSHFINVADFGAGGAVAEHVSDPLKQFGGFLSFFWGVMRTLVTFRPPHFELEIDGEKIEQCALTVIVANAEYYGGGIHVAPDARLDDGAFRVFVVNNVSLWTAMRNLRLLYTGRLTDRPDLVRCFHARRIALRSPQRVLANLDGELPGQLPATVEVVPGAIRLLTARPPA